MPGRDGTGPMGNGQAGRGLGGCLGVSAAPYGTGLGLGLRRGFCGGHGFERSFVADQDLSRTDKELLEEQKGLLERRLEAVNKSLENM